MWESSACLCAGTDISLPCIYILDPFYQFKPDLQAKKQIHNSYHISRKIGFHVEIKKLKQGHQVILKERDFSSTSGSMRTEQYLVECVFISFTFFLSYILFFPFYSFCILAKGRNYLCLCI